MKARLYAVVILLALAISLGAQAPISSPEQAGFSKVRLDRIRTAMEKQIADNRLAGGIALIERDGKLVYFETYGMADKESNKPMSKDAIFRIFSMTKAITGVSVMMLFEEGSFS